MVRGLSLAMAPNATSGVTGVLYEGDKDESLVTREDSPEREPANAGAPSSSPRMRLVWRNIIAFVFLHLSALYGLWLIFTAALWPTLLFGSLAGMAASQGVTAGVHRLWSHRSYKARWPLRVLLMVFNTMAFQNHIYEWSRDHRVHHKFSETDADPHNAKRGFFFSHMGWLMVRKHPDVKEKGKGVDMSDLEKDKIVMFQKKYYVVLMPVIAFIIPTCIPIYLWGETFKNAFYVATILRYVLTLHATWLVNSAAHMWGNKPYDKHISPSENLTVAYLAMGEGWHNYHHVFPWDYKAAELGDRVNLSTQIINFFARIGWAYDLKTVPAAMIKRRVERSGDGTHAIWGWGDKDMPQEVINQANIESRKTQ